jgi:hypothetical protein
MTPAAIVLAIVVATHNVDDQATESMQATAAEALGGEDTVVVREVETPSDAEALRIERSLHSQTVAQVVWLDDARTRARVRVHVAENNRWSERVIAFSNVDTPGERGRALGFAITSMLPEEALAARLHRARAGAARPPADVAKLRTAVRLSAIGSTGLGGTAGGIGGAIAGEFSLTDATLVRLGFGGRQGSVPALPGSSLVGYAGLGIAFWPLRPGPDRRIAVGLRLDALALYHSVAREAPGRIAMRQTKWLPGADALAEVGISVLGSFEIVGSAGVEVALGNSQLQVGITDPAEIPVLRGVAELGIRLSF